MNTFWESLLADNGFTFDASTGAFTYTFDDKRFSLCLEPVGPLGQMYLALYDRGFYGPDIPFPELSFPKVPIRPGYSIPEGPGKGADQPPARRAALRRWLVSLLAEIDKADQESTDVVPTVE